MRLVIDIGGSSVKYALWDKQRLLQPNCFNSPNTWGEMREHLGGIKKTYNGYHISAVGFSIPGVPNQDTGRVDGASSLHYLHDCEFIKEMQEVFQCPVYFENDANCASLAEITLGAGQHADNMIFLVVGTGIGGTVINNNKICSGHHKYGGEFGMMLINGRDEWSVLGSAVHMARKVSTLKKTALTGQEVFALAESGDSICKEAVEELYHYLALGIYNLQYIIDPELIILGGGISKKKDLIPNIERQLKKIMSYGQRAPIFPKLISAHYGNEANLVGAGLLTERLKRR